MAKFLVFDRVEGRSSKPVTYASAKHVMDVAMRLAYAEPSNSRVVYDYRLPKKGEIESLDAQRVSLKEQGQKLPGWVTFE